jgi:GNAT superfamily N-acetyltransferase
VTPLTYRHATAADLPFIVHLVALDDVSDMKMDDPERLDDPVYTEALAAIDADPNQELVIAELGGERVGTLQLTYLPGIMRRGMWRGLIESVHIVPAHRNKGLGTRMMQWAIARAREKGCGLVQLTSNKERTDAHRFYRRLGFQQSHEGFKLFF